MKKQLVARGILGSLSLCGVLGLVGCGAESGAPEEAEIGSTAEALTLAGGAAAPTSSPDARADFAAACTVRKGVSGAYVTLVTGGFTDAAGNATNEIYIYDPAANSGAGSWTAAVDTNGAAVVLTTARGHHSALTVPGDETSCVVAGGTTTRASTATVGTSQKLTIDSNGKLSKANEVTMSAERGRFLFFPCGSSKLIAIGGMTDGTAINTADVYDQSANSGAGAWSSLGNVLTGARFDLAGIISPSSSNTRFAVFGGFDGSSATEDLNLIKVNSSCASPTLLNVSDALEISNVSKARRAAAVVFDESPATDRDTYVLAGGVTGGNGSAASSDVFKITVDYSSSMSVHTALSSVSSPNYTASALSQTILSGGKYHVIGGVDLFPNLAETTNPFDDTGLDTLSTVQQWNSATDAFVTNGSLGATGSGLAASDVNGKIVVALGFTSTNGVGAPANRTATTHITP